MFSKILVANRGEIAIRAFRAGYELGAKTVAVFPYEDRNSIHRQKADEAYLIGEEGHPVRAYLDVDEVIRVAKEAGADAIYPGYGFLSENPRPGPGRRRGRHHVRWPARRGPGTRRQQGRRAEGRPRGRRPGAEVQPSRRKDVDELIAAADEIGFPIFAKAVAGGGGRGMRRVDTREAAARGALQAAMREADAAFGDPTMFLEQAVLRPRHIEVQILADARGQRHAPLRARLLHPAPPPEGHRDRPGAEPRRRHPPGAVPRRREVRQGPELRQNAGTVEFLVDTVGERAGQHVFIEMNPRIQVEHTVTEEVTDVDLVQAQMRIAAGETLADLGLSPGDGPAQGRRPAVPHHHRGPGQRLPPRRRKDHRLPLGRRRRRPARRRHRLLRRRDQPALRLDAGQADLPRPRLPGRRGPCPPRPGRVPHPRRLHQHLRSCRPCWTTPTSSPGTWPPPSSTSARTCSRHGCPRTAAPSC